MLSLLPRTESKMLPVEFKVHLWFLNYWLKLTFITDARAPAALFSRPIEVKFTQIVYLIPKITAFHSTPWFSHKIAFSETTQL